LQKRSVERARGFEKEGRDTAGLALGRESPHGAGITPEHYLTFSVPDGRKCRPKRLGSFQRFLFGKADNDHQATSGRVVAKQTRALARYAYGLMQCDASGGYKGGVFAIAVSGHNVRRDPHSADGPVQSVVGAENGELSLLDIAAVQRSRAAPREFREPWAPAGIKDTVTFGDGLSCCFVV